MIYKKFKITVKDKVVNDGEECIEDVVFISTLTKAKAERIAILIVADAYKAKTSDLKIENVEPLKKGETLNHKEFDAVAGIRKDEFGPDRKE
jgi:RNA-binding protein YlmH